MNDNHSGEVSVKRGWNEIKRNPSVDEVILLLSTIQAENGKEGPPDLVLEYQARGKSGQERRCSLVLMLAFHVTRPTLWIVHFVVAKGRGSRLLANQPTNREEFEIRTCCGVVQKYRVECLIPNPSNIRHAVEWFLEHRSMCPDLPWIEYDDAVRDP